MTVRYLHEQAERAERLAMGVLDTLACEALMKYARECRERANVAAPFATDQDTPISLMIGPERASVTCSGLSAVPKPLARSIPASFPKPRPPVA
jgi:hypothetical protein